jgi:hypothetical protein
LLLIDVNILTTRIFQLLTFVMNFSNLYPSRNGRLCGIESRRLSRAIAMYVLLVEKLEGIFIGRGNGLEISALLEGKRF